MGCPLRRGGARVDGVSRARRRRRRRLGRLRRFASRDASTLSTERRVSSRAAAYHGRDVSLRAGATRVSVRATVPELETRRVAATLRVRGGARRLARAGDPRARQVAQGRIAARVSSARGRRRAEDGRGRGRRRAGTRRRARRRVDRSERRRTTRGVVRIPVTQRRRDPSLRLVEHRDVPRHFVPVAGIIPHGGRGKGRGRGWDTGNHRRRRRPGDTTSRIPDPVRGRSRTNSRRTRMNFRGMRAGS